MGAKNKVISGDYEGKAVFVTNNRVVIAIGFVKNIILDENTVYRYEVINSEKQTSATRTIGKGAVGGLLLGPIGILAGLSAKKKGIYTISIQFNDGKKSLLEIDEKIYKAILRLSLNNSPVNEAVSIQQDIPEQIKKLAELKDQGILTEEEFNNKKADLLAKL